MKDEHYVIARVVLIAFFLLIGIGGTFLPRRVSATLIFIWGLTLLVVMVWSTYGARRKD